MASLRTIEIWVAINEEGKYETGHTRREAAERLNDAYGSPRHPNDGPIRMICITLTAPVPEVINCSATIPAEHAEVELKVA